MDLRKWIHYEVDNSGPKSLQKKAITALAGFLVLMLLFTVLSRSAAGLTIPQVKTGLPKSMMLDHDTEVSGVISANRDVVISTVDNIKVASIHTAEGLAVKAGETLFQLDMTDLKEQLEAAKDTLTKSELQQADILSGQAVAAQSKQKGEVRAQEDYEDTSSKADTAIQRALQEMNDAKEDIDLYESQMTEKQLAESRKKELAVARATEDYQKAIAAASMKIQKAFDEMNAANNSVEAEQAQILAKQGTDAQKKQTQITRATDAYNSAVAVVNREVDRANIAMNEAKQKADSYVGNGKNPEQDQQTWLSLQSDYRVKKQAYEDALFALTDKNGTIAAAQRAVEDANAIVVSDYKNELAALTQNALAKKQAYEAATADKAAQMVVLQRAIEDAQAAVIADSGTELAGLKDVYKAKKQAYEDALTSKEASLQAAQRSVEDSDAPEASNHVAELMAIDMKAMKQKINQLKALQAGNGKVTAPKDGIVTKLNLSAGDKTGAGAAAILKDASSGFGFKADITQKDAQYISEGDLAELTYNGGKDKLDNLKVESVYVSFEDSNIYHVTVSLPPGTVNPGSSGKLKVQKQSKKYDVVVPLEALHKESISTFVLVTKEENTVLGAENIVERIDVTVEDKNNEVAAIAGALSKDQEIIVDTNKPLTPGDRVRLVD
jgi:multidrug efflux pump subunit AcrA (membrane-fusion protein)